MNLVHRYEDIDLTAGYRGHGFTDIEVEERTMISDIITNIKDIIGDGNNKEN